MREYELTRGSYRMRVLAEIRSWWLGEGCKSLAGMYRNVPRGAKRPGFLELPSCVGTWCDLVLLPEFRAQEQPSSGVPNARVPACISVPYQRITALARSDTSDNDEQYDTADRKGGFHEHHPLCKLPYQVNWRILDAAPTQGKRDRTRLHVDPRICGGVVQPLTPVYAPGPERDQPLSTSSPLGNIAELV